MVPWTTKSGQRFERPIWAHMADSGKRHSLNKLIVGNAHIQTCAYQVPRSPRQPREPQYRSKRYKPNFSQSLVCSLTYSFISLIRSRGGEPQETGVAPGQAPDNSAGPAAFGGQGTITPMALHFGPPPTSCDVVARCARAAVCCRCAWRK